MVVRDEEDDRLLPHQIRRQRLTVKKATKMKVLTVRFCVDTQIVITGRVNFGHVPCVLTTGLKKDAFVAINAASDMLR